MRVRCKAIADYRSNAVGVVELECSRDGLRLELRGVSHYREGYAPGPPVYAASVTIPWPGVYATRLGELGILLSLDAQRVPMNRFLLVELRQRRPPREGDGPGRRALAGGLGAAALGALLLGLGRRGALPHPDTVATLGWSALCVGLLWLGARWLGREPELTHDEVLRSFSDELALHLPHHIPFEPEPTPPPRPWLPALGQLLPRSAVGIAVTLAATSLAALVGSSAARPSATGTEALAARMPALRPVPAAPSSPLTAPEPTPPAAEAPSGASLAAAELPAAVLGTSCRCARDEALLASEAPPRASALVLEQRVQEHDGHGHSELSVALVNNTSQPLTGLQLSVVFYEDLEGNAGQRTSGERPLYHEGPLLPGRSVRWHVEGRGTSFDLVPPGGGRLAPDGSDAAPGDAWDALGASGSRGLELHALRLLAFLGDSRAQRLAAVLRKDASGAEISYLERLARPAPPVATCALSVRRMDDSRWRVDACLDNRTDAPLARLGLHVLAYDAPLLLERAGAPLPQVLAEHTDALPEPLGPHAGRRLSLPASFLLEDASEPRAFEVVVEREEHLP